MASLRKNKELMALVYEKDQKIAELESKLQAQEHTASPNR